MGNRVFMMAPGKSRSRGELRSPRDLDFLFWGNNSTMSSEDAIILPKRMTGSAATNQV